MSAYLVFNPEGGLFSYSWYCSRECAESSPHYWRGEHWAETDYVSGLMCEAEDCEREEEL